MPLVAADVGCEQSVHPAAQVSIPQGPGRQMKMVRQHAICQNPHGIPELRFGQEVDKRFEIRDFRRAAGQSLPENPNRSTHSWESKRAPNYRRFS